MYSAAANDLGLRWTPAERAGRTEALVVGGTLRSTFPSGLVHSKVANRTTIRAAFLPTFSHLVANFRRLLDSVTDHGERHSALHSMTPTPKKLPFDMRLLLP